jgi:tetratricopeptide (TPR) repeat protein
LLEQAVEHSPVSLMYQRPRNLAYLSEALLLAGRLDSARSIAEQALHLCRVHGHRGFEADSLHILGEIYASLEPGELERAESSYREALALAEELEMRPREARCHLDFGALDLSRGRNGESRKHLLTAARLFREMDMRFWLEKAEARMSG